MTDLFCENFQRDEHALNSMRKFLNTKRINKF